MYNNLTLMHAVLTLLLPLHFHLIFILCIFFMYKIEYLNVTRLCHTRTILSVNGKFPGPRLVAREGDRVLVKVVNHISNNVTIHWYVYMHVLISFILQFHSHNIKDFEVFRFRTETLTASVTLFHILLQYKGFAA